jgi:CheY-like chemotaxis protein
VFCIPRYVVAESNSQKVADTHVLKSLAGGSESILVVEDEDGVRILMSRILRNLGYSVTAVENGERALAEFNTGGEKFDLIITDVIMPRLNGSDLANRILAKKPGTKILFISGYTGELLLRHGIDDRETQILKKPFSAEIIAGRVRAILDE